MLNSGGYSGFCGLPVFRSFARSLRKQSTGYVTSCHDTEIHWGLKREKSDWDGLIWFCYRRDENSTAVPSLVGATELNLTCHENTAYYQADGLDSSLKGKRVLLVR